MANTEFERMSLQDLVELRDHVARVLKARFELSLALLFTDVVGSTAYIAEHGDVAGRELMKRHHDLLAKAMSDTSGRVIDTAGDEAFCVADNVADGGHILAQLQRNLLEDNSLQLRAHRLDVRTGLHVGRVLVDEQYVSGEAVHAAARIMGTAGAGEIRISEQAFRELPVVLRPLCRRLEPQHVKGISPPVGMLVLDWRDTTLFPTTIEIVEAETVESIPYQGRVTLGRLAEHEGKVANDIVLAHPDPELTQRISRWQIELEMTAEGYLLRSMSRAVTELDGHRIGEGETAPVRIGSVARLSDVLTLRFQGPPGESDSTVLNAITSP